MTKINNITIAKLNEDNVENAIKFCDHLKEVDANPCSFWGCDKTILISSFKDHLQCNVIAIDSGQSIVGLGKYIRGGFLQKHLEEISLAIHPENRRIGLAARMLSFLESDAQNNDIKFFKALILANNIPSREFFLKQGYQHKATLFQEFNLNGYGLTDDCVYYKDL